MRSQMGRRDQESCICADLVLFPIPSSAIRHPFKRGSFPGKSNLLAAGCPSWSCPPRGHRSWERRDHMERRPFWKSRIFNTTDSDEENAGERAIGALQRVQATTLEVVCCWSGLERRRFVVAGREFEEDKFTFCPQNSPFGWVLGSIPAGGVAPRLTTARSLRNQEPPASRLQVDGRYCTSTARPASGALRRLSAVICLHGSTMPSVDYLGGQ